MFENFCEGEVQKCQKIIPGSNGIPSKIPDIKTLLVVSFPVRIAIHFLPLAGFDVRVL